MRIAPALSIAVALAGCPSPVAHEPHVAGEGEGEGEGEGVAGEGEGEGEGPVGEGEGEGEGEGSGVVTGLFVGGNGASAGIGGVRYEAGDVEGTTGDDGSFTVPAGSDVAFFVSDLALGHATAAPLVSPWNLAQPACVDSAGLEQILSALQSLDDDGDPSTGLHIPAFDDVTPRRDVTALSSADLAARVGELIPGRALVDGPTALDRFMRAVDDESWSELSHDTFTGVDALARGQGVATDGTNWFFSGWSLEAVGGVSKTDLDYNTLASAPIPVAQVLSERTDHMGDIDVYDGHVYAPLEDGHNNYQNPRVILVDTGSLDYGQKFTISTSLQSAGVPWVAVDPARNFAYLAEWDPTPVIHRFDLVTMDYVDDLTLVLPPDLAKVGRIQGAKVLGRGLYLSTDDDTKGIYKVDLETGTVIHLFDMIGAASEEEGLCVWARPDGSLLHTLNVGSGSTTAELHHHARTRAPLADALCP